MTVRTLLRRFEDSDVTITVYGPPATKTVGERLATQGIDATWRKLPTGHQNAFAVIRRDGVFAEAVPLTAMETFLCDPMAGIGDSGTPDSDPGRQLLHSALANTLLSSLTPAQLLATSHEFEDRAYRVGAGTLRVSFQSLSIFRSQRARYESLTSDTDLDIHVYGQDDWEPPAIPGISFHPLTNDTLEQVWLLAFDADGDDQNKCALVAEETEDGAFRGVWTYNPRLVDEIMAAVVTVDE
ncbi:DICT sensory domain-containing protein [Haloarcula sp. CBA1127]|uniref:DICT sensory domain-containing protein n=1 Tax=Haloarcula sp. CBA1127 TaxID=1765055 RepID=UPI00073F0D63|nr:DICT sensory domain-containing protein [Haloarcula sp. CBA1127]